MVVEEEKEALIQQSRPFLDNYSFKRKLHVNKRSGTDT